MARFAISDWISKYSVIAALFVSRSKYTKNLINGDSFASFSFLLVTRLMDDEVEAGEKRFGEEKGRGRHNFFMRDALLFGIYIKISCHPAVEIS